MKIKQGFSMHLQPHATEEDLYELKLFSHLWLGESAVTCDMIYGVLVEIDSEWADTIPHDQFSVLAMEIASQLVTAGRDVEEAKAFRENIATEIQKIAKAMLGK